MTTLIREV